MMTPDRHIWACALAIERQYGERGPFHIAERVGALVLLGDTAGVDMWRAIAARLDAMRAESEVEVEKIAAEPSALDGVLH